jgi:hypothetical protein
LEVVPQFSLVNWNRSSTWNKLTKQAGDKLAMVRDGSWSGLKTFLPAALKNGSSLPNQFAQVVINPVPHEDTGEFTCYVTNRATLPLQLVPSGPPSAGISGVTSDTLTNAVQNAPEATSVGWEVFGALVGGTLLGSGGMWAAGGMDLAKKVMLANSLSGEIADQALALISFAEQNNDAWMVRVVIDAILQATFPVSAQLPPEPTHGLANKVVKTIAAHPIPGPMIDTAYKVMTGGVVTSKIPVVSMEAAFPLEEALLFIDSALLHFAHTVFPPPPPSMFDMQKRPRIPAGYVSLRLCGKTEALLGMQKHDPTAMVEISLLGNPDDARMIQHFESIALGHESIFNSTNLPDVPSATLKHGILHWGQASGRMTKEDVHARYGKHVITQWTALQRELGGKTFVNAMMKRLGLA